MCSLSAGVPRELLCIPPLIKAGLDKGLDDERASSALMAGDPRELQLSEEVDGGLLRIWSSLARRASMQKLEADDLPVMLVVMSVGDSVDSVCEDVALCVTVCVAVSVPLVSVSAARLEGDIIRNQTTL